MKTKTKIAVVGMVINFSLIFGFLVIGIIKWRGI